MHCPNCGKPADTEQQFCRACGMSLETVGKLVAQHAPSSFERQKKVDKAELEQAIVRKMINWMIWGMIMIGLGVFMLVLNKSMDFGRWFSVVTSVLMLGGLGIATAGVFSAIKQGAGIQHKRSAQQIDAMPHEKSLPEHLNTAALPSITERTTQLISVDDVRKDRERS